MSPILHAMYAKPIGSPFMRERGRIITFETDVDLLEICKNGRIVVGRDGLPKMRGVPLESGIRSRKKLSFEVKNRREIEIINAIGEIGRATSVDIVKATGLNVQTVRVKLEKMCEQGIIYRDGLKKNKSFATQAYSFNKDYLGMSYKEMVEVAT